jgi:dipeptidyl aminopeptidase/acylaminoacyl peptidase
VHDRESYLLSLATGEKRVLTSPSPEWAYESSPAFTRHLSDLNIWRLEAPGDGGITMKSVKLIASTKTETAPQFSPDGRRIGFTSDRSGTMQVWVCDQDGSDPLQLTYLRREGLPCR